MAQLEGIPAGLWRSKPPALADLGILVLVYGRSHSQFCATVGSLKAKSRFAKGKKGRGGRGKKGRKSYSFFPSLMAKDLCFLPVLHCFAWTLLEKMVMSHLSTMGRHLKERNSQCEGNPPFVIRRSL